MAKPFPPHGKYKIYCDGRLLVSEVVGPWNIEFIRDWSTAAIPLCEELKAQAPWIAIAMISGSMLATPEAMDALRKVIQNSVQHYGCIAHVLVAKPEVAGRGIVEWAFQRTYDGLTQSAFFDDYESAKAWSLALLASHQKHLA